MKPYYETPLGRLWHGDCVDGMEHISSVDLVLTDPPYGISNGEKVCCQDGGKIPGIEYGEYDWDTLPDKQVFTRMISISKNQIIFGGNYFTKYLEPTNSWIFWDKIKFPNGSRPTNSDGELAWTSFSFPMKKITHLWRGMIKEAPEKRHHPTQKPVGLFVQIINLYSKSTDLILDPYSGSGTTLIACERLKRRWIGIEIEEKYCEIAAKRIEQERKQLKLF